MSTHGGGKGGERGAGWFVENRTRWKGHVGRRNERRERKRRVGFVLFSLNAHKET